MNTSHVGRTALACAAVALLANCGSSNGSTDSGARGSSADLVSVASVDGTDVLVDAQGHTLYHTQAEQGGQIRCVNACASAWVPILASAADVTQASKDFRDALGIVGRPGGGSQLTYEGLPLYTFAEEGPGELRGDGFTDDFQGTRFVWAAATTDGSATPSSGTPSSDGRYDY